MIQAVFCTRTFSVGGDPWKIEQLTLVPISLVDRSLVSPSVLIFQENYCENVDDDVFLLFSTELPVRTYSYYEMILCAIETYYMSNAFSTTSSWIHSFSFEAIVSSKVFYCLADLLSACSFCSGIVSNWHILNCSSVMRIYTCIFCI